MARIQALSCLLILLFVPVATAQSPNEKQTALLAENLTPWLDALAGRSERTAIRGSASPQIDGSAQTIDFSIQRYSTDAFDLSAEHKDYAMAIRRRGDTTVLALPKHKRAYFGKGDVDGTDHLHPAGLLQRLVSPGSSVSLYAGMILNADPKDLAGTLIGLADLKFDETRGVWQAGDDVTIEFTDHGCQIKAKIDGTPVKLTLGEPDKTPAPAIALPDYELKEVSRADLERQLCRGIRRAGEILAPSPLLTSPAQKNRRVEHGELRWIEGSRVALLWGTPEQIGEAHGKLLKAEAQRCIDSVLYTFGTVQTIVTGRWFRDDLASAYARLESHIPERHKQETAALARSLGQDELLIQTVNVFPELFHCSGFAVFGKATKDGKLYHGRVLDYMTEIGLQDASVTFIVAPTGHHAFANVGYAGFIGSVSGMNAEKISLGEMGGRGEGKWDGVPMATLMRRALEECSSLEEVKQLWRDSPLTCEYYYVFADGETKSAVGVAATPDSLQFVGPGEGHELLGEGIPDAVVLSAGSRLEELRSRVKKDYGKIDAQIGQSLMCRPVAMKSNLHNVLFVPEDGILYVANADHNEPAADRPYIKLDLNELLASMPKGDKTKEAVSLNERYQAKDSLSAGNESKEDAAACLAGLVWKPADFEIKLEPATKDNGDALVLSICSPER
ncbi:MAG: C45 family peptidase [Pirellulales bacterium]